MNCRESEMLMHGALDGELDLVHTLDVEAHLKSCESCAHSYESLRSLRSAVVALPIRRMAPDRLKARVTAEVRRLARADSPSRESRTRTWFEWRVAAPVVLAALTVVFAVPAILSGRASDTAANDVVSAHIRSLMADHLTDVPSTDRHTVKPWFNGKLPFAPPVMDLGAEGFPLVGGRLEFFGGHPAAALVYQRRKHTINLFVWPASSHVRAEPVFESRQGYQLGHWVQEGMALWAISDVAAGDLREFVMSESTAMGTAH